MQVDIDKKTLNEHLTVCHSLIENVCDTIEKWLVLQETNKTPSTTVKAALCALPPDLAKRACTIIDDPMWFEGVQQELIKIIANFKYEKKAQLND